MEQFEREQKEREAKVKELMVDSMGYSSKGPQRRESLTGPGQVTRVVFDGKSVWLASPHFFKESDIFPNQSEFLALPGWFWTNLGNQME